MSALADTDDTIDETPDMRRETEDAAALDAARHDPARSAPIYERYDRAIFGYCYRRLGHPEQAADATMQTFARALAGLNGFRAGSVRAWLFTIARNVVIDAARARRTHWPIEAAHAVPDAMPSPDDHAVRSDQERALFVALAVLTPDHRNVVELRLAGLTGPEIAAVLGISHGAVKASQHRAFARLRTLLAAEDIFGDPT
ncbi:MAG TPA: sigma-70 family RNA polymerase sigma factor [Thermomicrobiales bacterium]|nr:sigma-70 family RNA polymerase sigma factor [Thermomicrobiales bacterium]